MGWERWELSRLIKVIFIRGLNTRGWDENWELSRLIKVIFIRGLNTRGWDENDGNYLD